ncbi:MAG: sialidase family protein [Candidatus Brocadiia bacterium]
MLTKTDLFQAGDHGYHIYRVPGISVSPGGVVLAYVEARLETASDWADIDILMRRSLDGGQSWEPAVKVVDHADFGPGPANNFVTIPDRDTGEVHALHCHDYARVFYRASEDHGETFSDPLEITDVLAEFRSEYDWGVCAVGPGHGIQLDNGRLLAPIWLSESHTHAHRPNRAAVIYSDDHGATWQRGDMVPDTIPCCNETEAVQLADGRVLLNMRNMGEGRRRAVTVSNDDVHDWAEPWHDDELPEPRCFGSIHRLTKEGEDDRNRILFSNPDVWDTLEDNPIDWGDRRDVTVRLSYDECETWPVKRRLQEGPSGYSDLAVLPDSTVLCIYERGRVEGGHTASNRFMTVAHFDLEWLTEGADSITEEKSR